MSDRTRWAIAVVVGAFAWVTFVSQLGAPTGTAVFASIFVLAGGALLMLYRLARRGVSRLSESRGGKAWVFNAALGAFPVYAVPEWSMTRGGQVAGFVVARPDGMLAFYPVGRKDVPAMLEIPPADVSSVTITRNPLIGNSRDVVIDRGGQPMPVTVLMAKHFGATVAATALGDRVQIQD